MKYLKFVLFLFIASSSSSMPHGQWDILTPGIYLQNSDNKAVLTISLVALTLITILSWQCIKYCIDEKTNYDPEEC